jgi:hypothetical protein
MTNDICLKGSWPPEAKVGGGFWINRMLDIFSIGRYNFYMFMFKFQLRKATIWKK